MLLVVDAADPTPIYQQIARQVRAAVASGDLRPGERLPTARIVADGLGVNMHTIRQAFTLLQREGVLEVRRGRGVSVAAAAAPESAVTNPGLEQPAALAAQLVQAARAVGSSDAEVLQLVASALSADRDLSPDTRRNPPTHEEQP